jgi:predicted dehydrogenase
MHGIGFIGAGAIAELHQLAVSETPHAQLRGIVDANQVLAQKRAEEWGVRAYHSIGDMIKSDDIDIIYVLSPVEYHFEHTIKSLQAGKHVLIEKPVAMTTQQIREMEQVAVKANRICFPAHNYIYHPEVIKMKKYIDEGAFGNICSAWMTFNIFHSEELASHYPGVIRQIMTHHLYTTLFLLGTPQKLGALSSNLHYEHLDREDQAVMVLEMPSGAHTILFSSFACDDDSSHPFTYMIKILGTKGSAQHSWRDIQYNRAIGTLNKAYPKYEELFAYETKYFIEECIMNGKPPLSTISDAAVVQELVELTERHQNSKIVSYVGRLPE